MLSGFTFGATGKDVYVAARDLFAGPNDPPARLHVSRDGGASWAAPIVSPPMGATYRCLGFRAGKLYACGGGEPFAEPFLLGVSGDEGASWAPVGQLSHFVGGRSCVRAQCQATEEWLCESFGACAPDLRGGDAGGRQDDAGVAAADAGPRDATGDACGGPTCGDRGGSSGGWCSVEPASEARGFRLGAGGHRSGALPVRPPSTPPRPLHYLYIASTQNPASSGCLAGAQRAEGPMVRCPAPASSVMLALLAVGCTGSINKDGTGGDPGRSGEPGPGRPPTAGENPGGSGPSSGGGPAAKPTDPGRVTLRRLNRPEYCNTLRDLLGTRLRPCDQLPADNVEGSFDTVAATQSVSPLHIEIYERGAGQLVDELMALPADDARRRAVFGCAPGAAAADPCAREIILGFARLAWRRPVTADELDGYLGLVDVALGQGGTTTEGVRLALQALLMSPAFLFRVEVDREPGSLTPHRVNGFELASRLSYGLWSTMPDPELTTAAEQGQLGDDAGVGRQVERMLRHPKAGALATDFAGQWLRTRYLVDHEVDPTVFPGFDPALRVAMREETERVFSEFLRLERPARELLLSDFTFIDPRLARHYGLPAPAGGQFGRVSVAGTDRQGLLAHGGILTVTSHPNRTSAVKRGVWVAEQLLCARPPDPPPDVEALPANAMGRTQREVLAIHRSQPACQPCHALVDPIGLGLENYDAIGRFRSTENGGAPIDSAGELPDGRRFSGPRELADLLASDPRFDECMTSRLMTYLLGRTIEDEPEGRPWIPAVAQAMRDRGGSFGALVSSIVASEPFTMRRGETSPSGGR